MQRSAMPVALCLLALAAAAVAGRVPALDKRPMHPDEANQAVKAGELYQDARYEYDPEEHHGPTLYWLTLPSLWLGGAEGLADSREAEYRIVPVLFAAGAILLLVLLIDALGPVATVLAGVFLFLSPAMVYYSRYYIQETLLVFFTLAALGCGWRFVKSGRTTWAMAAGAFVGLMHATKETWVLAAAAAAVALPATILWGRLRDGEWPDWRSRVRPGAIIVAVAAACLVAVAFYSSFGVNPAGPLDSILAYKTYLQRGTEAGVHDHPWYYYLALLTYNRAGSGFFFSEGLIVALAAVGAAFALGLRDCRAGEGGDGEARGAGTPLVRFLAFYTLFLTAIYSAIPYKTPWCVLSFLQGMTLLAGFGAWSMLRVVPTWPVKLIPAWPPKLAPTWPLRLVLAGLLIAGMVNLWRQNGWLNDRLAADQRNPYVYAHTSSDLLAIVAMIERLAAVSPEGHDMMIEVVTPENYWPLPWYLRGFNPDHVGYWHDPAAWARDTAGLPPASLVIFTPEVQSRIDAHLRGEYMGKDRPMRYGLRPKVYLHLYVRKDLWAAFEEAASKPRPSARTP